MAKKSIGLTKDELLEAYIISRPDLWAESHLRNPMDPSKPLRLRDYQRKALTNRHQRKLIRWGRRCIAWNDIIYTGIGALTVEQLFALSNETPIPILTVNLNNFTAQPTLDYEVWYNDCVPTVEIVLLSGRKQRVTLDHPFLALIGDEPEWIEAQDILPDMQIAAVDTRISFSDTNPVHWERVVYIEEYPDPIDTYDIYVPETQCFVGNGIVQHNTGKSVYLASEALWKAFTHNNRQVLLVTAYESQIDNLFDLIRRMALDSPHINNSVKGMRKKPYELWLKNGSVIRGMIANSSIRGKCLIAGTQVWMSHGGWKSIEDVRVGEKVITLNPRTLAPESGEVVNTFVNGLRDVYELRTTSARRLIATDNHPLFVFTKGWTPLKDIKTKETHGHDAHFIAVVDALGQLNWARVQSITHIGKLPTYDIEVKDYHHFIAFYPTDVNESGFSVSGLSNGGILVHNSADDLIIDEGDYIPQDVLTADVWPIATTYSHTEVIFSSTPTGRREFFWTLSVNKDRPEYNFVEFHIPSTMSPEWTPEQEALVRSITTHTQFQREYLAEFGEATEGVFRNREIDEALYVYDYKDLKQDPKNYYTLGVDWNEAKNGVQIVMLEYLNKPAKMIPYNMGNWDKKNVVERNNVFRVFGVWEIDALEYTNTRAVDKILEIISKYQVNYLLFDHGHGHTNWELLRLAIMRGVSSTGFKCPGLKHYLERMDVVDFGGVIKTIDPYTQTTTAHKAKNVLVKLAISCFERNMVVIPAVNTDMRPIEDNERALVPQLRDYSIARYGPKGEVYEAGPSGDHRLDAFLLALYAYSKEHDQFLRYNFNLEPALAEDHLTPAIAQNRLISTPEDRLPKYRRTESGLLVRDYGDWTKKGEPPDNFDESPSGLIPTYKPSFTKRNSRKL